jgi:predicted RNase H-like nuclease (RuvC/YqgF family)
MFDSEEELAPPDKEIQVDLNYQEYEVRKLKSEVNSLLNEVDLQKNTNKNLLWELSKIREELIEKATVKSILKLNNKLLGKETAYFRLYTYG